MYMYNCVLATGMDVEQQNYVTPIHYIGACTQRLAVVFVYMYIVVPPDNLW